MPLLAGLTVIRTVIGSMPFDKVPPCVQFFGFVSASIPPLMCFCARPVISLLAGPPACHLSWRIPPPPNLSAVPARLVCGPVLAACRY